MLTHGDTHPNAIFPLDTAEMLFAEGELRDVQAERAAVQRELLELRAEALQVTAALAALRAETARLTAEKLALEEELLESGGVSSAATTAMLGALDGERRALAAQVRVRETATAERAAREERARGREERARGRETAEERAARDARVYAWETKHIFGSF